MKKLALSIMIVIAICLSACQTPQTNTDNVIVSPAEMVGKVVQTSITEEMVNISPTATFEETAIPTTEVTPSSTPLETVEASEQVTEKSTQKLTENPTHTPKPTIAPTPIATKKPIAEPTPATTPKPTAESTPKPTQAPSYMVISSSIRSGALQGINEAREEEGNPSAQLDSGLNSQAESHAIEMAKADSLYHSSLGYVESVRSGANIGGWAEGYGAANHATQLCLDEEIMRIGVGSAKAEDRTVYTCIIGAR